MNFYESNILPTVDNITIKLDNSGNLKLDDVLKSKIEAETTNITDSSNNLIISTSIIDDADDVISNTVNNKIAGAKSLKAIYEKLQTNFQGGVDKIYNAVKAKGSTPIGKSLDEVVSAIENIHTGKLLVGTYSGNQAIDISAYKGSAADDFIVEVVSFPDANSGSDVESTSSYAYIVGTTCSKNISGNNLVTSGMSIPFNGGRINNGEMIRENGEPISYADMTYNVWYIH